MPYAVDGEKCYRFTVRWGAETDTDDARGRVVATSERAPEPAAIAALLPRFTGEILQTPPAYSAIKIDGKRAYDLAREGETVELEPRPVHIDRPCDCSTSRTPIRAVFEARCGKGTYVRALARDMGRALGCLGHLIALRRTRVAGFDEAQARHPRRRSRPRPEDGRGGAACACCCRSRPPCRTSPSSASARTTPRACCAASPC